jgi:hypothetical protein
MVFHYVFGLFKITVILQQIYKRYLEGKTHDERFAALGIGVQLLAAAATAAISAGRL